jgi:hypothetical protein
MIVIVFFFIVAVFILFWSSVVQPCHQDTVGMNNSVADPNKKVSADPKKGWIRR